MSAVALWHFHREAKVAPAAVALTVPASDPVIDNTRELARMVAEQATYLRAVTLEIEQHLPREPHE